MEGVIPFHNPATFSVAITTLMVEYMVGLVIAVFVAITVVSAICKLAACCILVLTRSKGCSRMVLQVPVNLVSTFNRGRYL